MGAPAACWRNDGVGPQSTATNTQLTQRRGRRMDQTLLKAADELDGGN
jgi:hypothetical protein